MLLLLLLLFIHFELWGGHIDKDQDKDIDLSYIIKNAGS